MDLLPIELVVVIFENLHFAQKLECMRVSRRWAELMSRTSLYSIVHLRRGFELEELQAMIRWNLRTHGPRTGDEIDNVRRRIETLVIHNAVDLLWAADDIVTTFLMLSSIHLYGANLLVEDVVIDENFRAWRNQIQVLTQQVWNRVDSQVMLEQRTRYEGLRDIKSTWGTGPLFSRPFDNDLFGDLFGDYTPNLQHLTITDAQISIQQVEDLHRFLPNLISLKMKSVTLSQDILPEQIQQINTLETLSIDCPSMNQDTMEVWLRYIGEKYSVLVNFRFYFPWLSSTLIRREEVITRQFFEFTPTAALESLEFFCSLSVTDLLNHFITARHDPALDGRIHSPGQLNNTINRIRQTLNRLHLNVYYPQRRRLFHDIGYRGSLITELTIFTNAAAVLTPWKYRALIHLKTLRIRSANRRSCRNVKYYLNDILNICSQTVTSFEIHDFFLSCRGTLVDRPGLEKLAIHTMKIDPIVYVYISDHLPQLRRLTIERLGRIPNPIPIHIPRANLWYFDILLHATTWVQIITTDGDPDYPRYYHVNQNENNTVDYSEAIDYRYLNVIKRVDRNQIPPAGNAIVITCDKVANLTINKKYPL